MELQIMPFTPSFDRCDTVVVISPCYRKQDERLEVGGRILGALLGVTAREASWSATVVEGSEAVALGFSEENRPDIMVDDEMKDYSGLVRLALGLSASDEQIYLEHYSPLSIKVVFDSICARWCLVQPGYCGAYDSKDALIEQLRKLVPKFDSSDFARDIRNLQAV